MHVLPRVPAYLNCRCIGPVQTLCDGEVCVICWSCRDVGKGGEERVGSEAKEREKKHLKVVSRLEAFGENHLGGGPIERHAVSA